MTDKCRIICRKNTAGKYRIGNTEESFRRILCTIRLL
ncbi:hypothetical protein CLOL250_00586 [Clostridium sp. L2-50]|nr:hypothetical protein CLOL250_00586 [Clostridium sp. L2-50]